MLYSAVAADGEGSTPSSGASVDATAGVQNITVLRNDFPNGLLQFSAKIYPGEGTVLLPPALEQPEVNTYQLTLSYCMYRTCNIGCCTQIRVSENIGVVSLLVERAQGLLGDAAVEWRTEDQRAVSSGAATADYQVMHVAAFWQGAKQSCQME